MIDCDKDHGNVNAKGKGGKAPKKGFQRLKRPQEGSDK